MGDQFSLASKSIMKTYCLSLAILLATAVANASPKGMPSKGPDCPPPPKCLPPKECGPDEIHCPDMTPPPPKNDCPMCEGDCPTFPPCPGQGSCMPAKYDNPNKPGSQCANMCPSAPCGQDQHICPKDFDSEGCPLQETCAPMPTCGEKPMCPKTHEMNGCPAQPECDYDSQIRCTPAAKAGEDCPPMSYCMERKFYKPEGQVCFNFCPRECEDGMEPCPPDFDDKGCPMPNGCAKAGALETECPRNHAPNGCTILMPPKCVDNGEVDCPVGSDEKGCHMGFTCAKSAAECPQPYFPAPEF